MASEGPLVYGTVLENPPTDGVSALQFSRNSDLLLVGSWDGVLRLYDAARNSLRGSYTDAAPILDCKFHDDSACFSGGLDSKVKRYDFFSRAEQTLGRHDKPVKAIEFLREKGLVASGSWDGTLRLWDPRVAEGSNCAALIQLPGKVYTISQSPTRLVVGTSDRRVLVYDLRSIETGKPEQVRESSLKYQTRCISCFPNGTGYALSSIEGRVAMEYFDMSEESQAKKYAFKCHRKTEDGTDYVYPVNAISFHPVFGTFATGGCDGVVNIWDGENKKRLFQISKYPTSIAALAFNASGSVLAVASSYTFEYGERDHPAESIYLRRMAESEVKPKPRK